MTARKHAPDYVFVGLVAALTVGGLLVLSSASAAVAFEKFGDPYYYIKRQLLFGFLPGIVFFAASLKIPPVFFERVRVAFFGAVLVLLSLVLIPGFGAGYGSAKSWLTFGDFSLQPSELLKIALVLFLAGWCARNRSVLHTFMSGGLPFFIFLGVIALLLMLQPDLGTLAVILAISFAVFFVAGASLKQFGILLAVGAAAFVLMVAAAPYRLERFTTFLHPQIDPQGAGYQINQSLLALGSGGWFGVGVGYSRQKFRYLPEVVSDSIFAIVGEEMGFAVTGAFMVLLLFLWLRMLRIARAVPDDFSRLAAVGIMVWFMVQSFLNIGASVGLLPLTGVPLPFISHGGTALFVSLWAAGIVGGISRFTRAV